MEKEQTKVIEIRPFHELKQEQVEQTDDNEAVEKTSLKQEIERAKQKLQAVENERKKLLAKIHQEIESEKKVWEQTKEEEMERVQQEGYKAGFEQGKNESLSEFEYLINEGNELVSQAKEQYYKQLQQSESVIVQLAMQAAEKILNQTLSTHPEKFIPLVQKAIQDLKDNLTYSIFLHPKNYETVLKQKDELYESVTETATISLYIDDELEENSCLIEHASGKIDASINTQLSEIKQVLVNLAEKNK